MGREIWYLFRRDFVLGLFSLRYRLLSAIAIFIFILVISIQQLLVNGETVGIDGSTLNFTDLLFSLFRGTDFEIIDNPKIEFPFSWFMIQAFIPFVIGGYVREDFYEQSSFIFVRVQYRISLWISKLLFSIVIVLLLYVTFMVISLLISSLFLSSTLNWSENTLINIKSITEEIPALFFLVQVIIGPILTGMITAFIHTVLTVFMKPIYSLLVVISLLVTSVYSTNPFLPGSYSMILRHEIFEPIKGFVWGDLFIYLSTVFILFGFVGYTLFKNMDIYQKERG